VEIFFHLASKWSKWCTQTLHPFSQILKIFLLISAPIIAPPNDGFRICSISWKGNFFPVKNDANHVKIGLEKKTLVEVIHYVTDTVKLRKCDTKTEITGASHRPVLFDFHQTLHGGRGDPCHHLNPKRFLGPVNSLVARGTKPKN